MSFVLAGLLSPESNRHFFQIQFSPDVRCLLVARGDTYVALDLTKFTTFSITGAVRDRIGESFSFLGNDRILGLNMDNSRESAIVTFPQGQVVARLKLGAGTLIAATHGDGYFVVRPIANAPVGIFNVKENKLVLANQTAGFDIYDGYFLSERKSGELGLYRFDTQGPVNAVMIPTGPLGQLRAAEVSADFGLLAISQRTRGALWDLKSGQRKTFVRGFRGAYLDADQCAYLDSPKEDKVQRAIVRVNAASMRVDPLVGIDPPAGASTAKKDATTVPQGKMPVQTTITAARVAQYGPYLVGWLEATKARNASSIVIYEARSVKELWSRSFPKSEPDRIQAEGRHNTLAFFWHLNGEGGRKILDANPDLNAQFSAMKTGRENVDVAEVVDFASGKPRGNLLIDLGNGSLRVQSIVTVGDNIVMRDNQNRTLVYSLATGKQLGHAFGTPMEVSKDGSTVFVQNNPGEVTLYSLPQMEKRDEMTFSSRVVFARFSDDGRRLFVLTEDHTAYTIAVKEPGTGVPYCPELSRKLNHRPPR